MSEAMGYKKLDEAREKSILGVEIAFAAEGA